MTKKSFVAEVTFKQMIQLIGRLSLISIAVFPAPLQYQSLQHQQILELVEFIAHKQWDLGLQLLQLL